MQMEPIASVPLKKGRILRPGLISGLIVGVAGVIALTGAASAAIPGSVRPLCDDNSPLCTEINEFPNGTTSNYEGTYVGHDEPSVLFYSNVPGSGNSNTYRLVLPKDPPVQPNQAGTRGTFNFQLHPAFWFGMAMCDTQSYPNPGNGVACKPDSDANIFDGNDPTKAQWIGNHPGTAFMEMQFYPPGWVLWPPGNSCDAYHWCAALNIDSLSEDPNAGTSQNPTCASIVGVEYVNFAFITLNGKPHPGGPPSPVNSTLATFTPDPTRDLFMNSGDELIVEMHDTPQGFQVVIHDLTTDQTGSMIASAKNGFGQVQYDPTGSSCNNVPYNFHPMYSTSSEHTRVPWAAHSYNVAFADEIGHFEYCSLAGPDGACTQAGVNDPAGLDGDDVYCFNAGDSSRIAIGGCLSTEGDFDGVPYGRNWPGTASNPFLDLQLHPSPVLFSSPTFVPHGQPWRNANYDRVAFEADMPRIEQPDITGATAYCDRTTGAGCTNPPKGAAFYPIFSTRNTHDSARCMWQLGGANIPGTSNAFGGNSTTEYGPVLSSLFQVFGAELPEYEIDNFHRGLSTNPCPNGEGN